MTEVTSSQMSTQSVRATQELGSQSLDSSADEAVWGRLLALRANIKVYNLSESSITFGRGLVDHQLSESCFDRTLLPVISKRHFRITREVRSGGLDDPVVLLEDLSSNGTFLNQRLIGKNKKCVLKNNDEIGLAQATTKVFMFYDCANNDADQYPEELTAAYTITRKIGEGNYGEVRLAYKQGTLERCAVKILKKKIMSANGNTLLMNHISQITNEISLLQSINHPCIVRLWDVKESADCIYIVMELAEGGELFDRISGNGYLDESDAKLYCYQLALAIEYLHSRDITHRDIKPENILLSSDKRRCCVKLTDFGLSKLTQDASKMSTFCGTQMYIAPELLDPNSRAYTNKVDLWSFGVVIFVCMGGYPPFYDQNELKLRYLIRTARFTFARNVWDLISDHAKDLIKHLLVSDPKQRYNISETLQHPWFQEASDMRAEAAQLLREAENPCTPVADNKTNNNGIASSDTAGDSTAAAALADSEIHFNKPDNKRPLTSPEARRRMQEAKTPKLN